ncbi:YiiX/YebB-like N1pC/P60 family cysteine hydrolase [Cupriavidus sp. SK-3]|uniref:YiiX/YebB-like N1pC/P60 family cysteine hydrolase n=1 Tax=Cupriavidus sp. SK-3 TaxID=1470558 RepID=UPI0009DFC1B4|nr:YiiX/YebB-like N1pC/P60 family cysteine hydrolase [Cupriavidus sp. SK-3]
MSRPLMIAGAALAGLALGACATQWGSHADDLNVAAAQGSGLPLRFQQMSLEVSGVEVRPLDIDALQVGDILLSAATSFNSSAIRLATISQVSHSAVYVGGGNVVEAVGSGVRVYPLQQALNDGDIIVAYRHPGLDDDMRLKLHAFAMAQVGQPYNHLGIAMHAPFSLERRLCELPGVPGVVRNACMRSFSAIQMAPNELDARNSFFCSQLVLASYRAAGLSLTSAADDAVSPADLLHMREGDVPSFRVTRKLAYVGRLTPVSALRADGTSASQSADADEWRMQSWSAGP